MTGPIRSEDYSDQMPLGEARRLFFLANGFGADGGYTKRFFWLGLKWLRVPVPNTAGRLRAVRLHDFHHIATGYGTSWRGEAEIGAWELGGGCGRYAAAWVLNLYAFGVGLLIAPRAVWRAFLRGRRSRNLYHGRLGAEMGDDALQAPLRELRSALRLTGDPIRPVLADFVAFGRIAAGTALLNVLTYGVPLALASVAFVAARR